MGVTNTCDLAEDERLANVVKQFSILYDKNIPGFKEKELTEAAWESVEKQLGLEKGTAARRFTTLRKRFTKKLRLFAIVQQSGFDGCDVSDVERKLNQYSFMKWLSPYIKLRTIIPLDMSATHDEDDGDTDNWYNGSMERSHTFHHHPARYYGGNQSRVGMEQMFDIHVGNKRHNEETNNDVANAPTGEKIIKIEDDDSSSDSNDNEEYSTQTSHEQRKQAEFGSQNSSLQPIESSIHESISSQNRVQETSYSKSNRSNTSTAPSHNVLQYSCTTPPQSVSFCKSDTQPVSVSKDAYNPPLPGVSPNDEIYGKMIASELSQLPQHLKVLAKQELSNVLFKYLIQANMPAQNPPAAASFVPQTVVYPTVASVHSTSIP